MNFYYYMHPPDFQTFLLHYYFQLLKMVVVEFISKLTFVPHCKISLENLRIKSYDQLYHEKVEKSWKTLISN